jgi:hypothetical protein
MRAEVSALMTGVPVTSEGRPAERRHQPGGAWLRPFRRWDGYREAVAAALRQLQGRGGEGADAESGAEREEELAGR